ncbi:unnamed protein product [Dovyalis caffra]|uniref:Uncharacterized protein n=1 Tax=Dovyalis caffra TaxID=77055 RepID=A0AAV1SC59_9ROSI|nr:unnamed protein product [Dovyalis caffra]
MKDRKILPACYVRVIVYCVERKEKQSNSLEQPQQMRWWKAGGGGADKSAGSGSYRRGQVVTTAATEADMREAVVEISLENLSRQPQNQKSTRSRKRSKRSGIIE